MPNVTSWMVALLLAALSAVYMLGTNTGHSSATLQCIADRVERTQ